MFFFTVFEQVQATIDITIGSASAEGRKWNIRFDLNCLVENTEVWFGQEI